MVIEVEPHRMSVGVYTPVECRSDLMRRTLGYPEPSTILLSLFIFCQSWNSWNRSLRPDRFADSSCTSAFTTRSGFDRLDFLVELEKVADNLRFTKLLEDTLAHGESFMAIFNTLSVVIWFSTGTLRICATLVYVFTMLVGIYDILSMAIIPTLSTYILFCNLCYVLL